MLPWEDVEFRVVATKRDDPSRGMVAAYITARAVMNQLDAVCDAHGWIWSDRYRRDPLDQTHVECTIVIDYRDGIKISRADVGAANDDKGSEADGIKTAYSDAFKRAAVKFGIGRFLYSMPRSWVDLDDYKQIKPEAYDGLRKGYDAVVAGERPRGRRPSAPRASGAQRPAQAPRGGSREGAPAPAASGRPDYTKFWGLTRELGYSQAQVIAEAGKAGLPPIPQCSAEQLAQIVVRLTDIAAGKAVA